MSADNLDNLNLAISTPEENTNALPKSRVDVEITEQVYFGKPCYVLKDPATLRYYRLRPPEYTIYRMMDGKTDTEEILKVLAERFPNEQFDKQALMSFVIMLRGANLLQISGGDNTDYLLKRKKMLTRNVFQKVRSEYLFFRIPFFDPDKLLNFLHAHLGKLIYSRFAMVLVWLLLIGAFASVLANIDKFGQRQALLSWYNMLYLAPALLVIKLIHEFGHGLTSKHFGTEVHEMGLLFLVFTPCFYCDVSDAWMISEKRKRMWITAAGIVVEIVLAGLAAYIWSLTNPKTVINQFALNMMLAASLNTLLFNGNPLLRYDGYYFMMDLIEMPNLKQKGSAYLWYLLQKYLLGVDSAHEPIDAEGREFTLIGYAVCSAIYRWFIMIAIVTMVWTFLDPYGWGVVGGLMAIGCIYTSFIKPIFKFVKYVFTQKQRIQIRLATAIILVLIICGAVYGLLLLPVEQTVEAQCVLRPAGMQPFYVTQPGFIRAADQRLVRDGQKVEAGEILLKLFDPHLEYQVKDFEIEKQQLELNRVYAIRQKDTAMEDKLKAQIDSLQARYKRARHDLDKLTIRAPADGMVQLRTEEPLRNLDGTYLPLQTELFAIYQPGQFEAVVAVNHRDIELVQPNQKVEIKMWALDNEVFESKVKEKPPTPVFRLSSAAFSTAFQGEVATMPTTSAEEALDPADNTYELLVPMKENDPRLRDGLVGRAKIIVEKKTLGRAFYLWLIRTLRQDIRL